MPLWFGMPSQIEDGGHKHVWTVMNWKKSMFLSCFSTIMNVIWWENNSFTRERVIWNYLGSFQKNCLMTRRFAVRQRLLFWTHRDNSISHAHSWKSYIFMLIFCTMFTTRPATILFFTIRYISRYRAHDTIHDTICFTLII